GVEFAGVVGGGGVSRVEPGEIWAADVVALRFPADWIDETPGSLPAETAETTAEAPAAPAAFALASAESRPVESNILFSPQQTYRLPPGALALAPVQGAADDVSNSRLLDPRATMPSEIKPAAKIDAKSEARTDAKADTKTATTRSIAPAPERHPAPRVRKDSGTLFNDAQLASIKGRLKLTPDQEHYWPGVEAALRAIGWRAAHSTNMGNGQAKLAAIDPDSSEVQQLKSAAFPLIMSMNEDQKREVRTLAQVMGLERVAASF